MKATIELTEEEFDFICEWIDNDCWGVGKRFYERYFHGNDLEILKQLDEKGFVLSLWDEEEKNLCYHVTSLFNHIYENNN